MKGKRVVFFIIIALLITSKLMYINPQQMNVKKPLEIFSEKVNAKENTSSNQKLVQVSDAKNNKRQVAILSIPGTDYTSPIMQSKDNKYYLNHDENDNKSRGGTPFLDYRVNIDTSRKLLIYGHNSRYTDMPFKILESYYDESFYNNHRIIKLEINGQERKYEVFSVYTETSDWDYTKVKFETYKEWLDHINDLSAKSIYKSDTKLTEKDKILILQTCSTKKEYRKYKKKFLLIIARKVG